MAEEIVYGTPQRCEDSCLEDAVMSEELFGDAGLYALRSDMVVGPNIEDFDDDSSPTIAERVTSAMVEFAELCVQGHILANIVDKAESDLDEMAKRWLIKEDADHLVKSELLKTRGVVPHILVNYSTILSNLIVFAKDKMDSGEDMDALLTTLNTFQQVMAKATTVCDEYIRSLQSKVVYLYDAHRNASIRSQCVLSVLVVHYTSVYRMDRLLGDVCTYLPRGIFTKYNRTLNFYQGMYLVVNHMLYGRGQSLINEDDEQVRQREEYIRDSYISYTKGLCAIFG